VKPVAKQSSVCNSGANFFQSMTGSHVTPSVSPLTERVYWMQSLITVA